MSKKDVINYVMNTPGNTNPAVLETLLDNDKFIITLTPTAEDYSGTMDKTAKEITDAVLAGKEIYFNILHPTFQAIRVKAYIFTKANGHDLIVVQTMMANLDGQLIHIWTDDMNGDDSRIYHTGVYQLNFNN